MLPSVPLSRICRERLLTENRIALPFIQALAFIDTMSPTYKVDGSGRLHQRVAIVTGASSGMGRGIALGLAREGAYVVCSDLKPEAAQHGFEDDKDIPTHQVIINNGGKAAFKKCDMGVTEEIIDLIKFAVDVSLSHFLQGMNGG